MIVFKQKKIKVLAVDDRADGRLAIKTVLTNVDYQLVLAKSGNEALACLNQNEFAVILMDVQMPLMDGFETVRQIKKNELWKYIPIIFLTAINKEIAHIYKGYQYGAVDYIFKPFDPWVLKSKVSVFVDLFKKDQKIRLQSKLLLESKQKKRVQHISEIELESQRLYQSLADAIPHIIWKGKLNGSIDYFNQLWYEYTGYTAQQSLEIGWQSALDTADKDSFLKKWQWAIENKQSFEIECRIKKSDGTSRWHLIRVTFDALEGGSVINWIGTCTDIHHRKEAEEKLQKAWEELEKRIEERTLELELANRALQLEMDERLKAQKEILEISSREQERIGQDLHDGLAQHLTGISFKSKILQQKLTTKELEEDKDAYEILDLLKQAIGETKRMARGFYPIELEKRGLLAALTELSVHKEKMFNVVCKCRWDPTIKIEERSTQTHLYRIIQEAIHNSIRHGKAKHIQVSGAREFESRIVIRVQDDGVGISNTSPSSSGMGLRIMEYRSSMIGASLQIKNRNDGGTCVEVNLPVIHEESKKELSGSTRGQDKRKV